MIDTRISGSHRTLASTNPDIPCPPASVIAQLLNRSAQASQFTSYASSRESGFEPFLPPDTRSHVVLPFYDGKTPLFTFIATSPRPLIPSESLFISTVRSMAAILRVTTI